MTAVASRKTKSLSKVVHLTSPKETNTLRKHKHTLAAENIEQKNSFVYGNVPPDNSDMEDLVKSRKKLVAGSTGKSLKPPHRGRPSSTKSDVEELSAGVETLLKSGSDTVTNTKIQRRLFTDDTAKDASREKTPTSTCSKSPSRRTLPNDNCKLFDHLVNRVICFKLLFFIIICALFLDFRVINYLNEGMRDSG